MEMENKTNSHTEINTIIIMTRIDDIKQMKKKSSLSH